MTKLPAIVSLCAVEFSLMTPRVVLAQTTTAPVPAPVLVLHNEGTAAADLQGVPPAVAKLIASFDVLRDKYLLKQHLLQEKLKNATTQEQREAIRQELQDNRQAFLDELSDFRTQLKDELKSVRGRVSNAEFLRIIGTAPSAPGDHHHRGH